MIDRWALVSSAAIRRMPWMALAPTIALCTAVVWAQALGVDERLDLMPAVRIAIVLVAAASATCLEDPNELLVDSTPFGRLRRRCLAVAMTGLASLLAAGALLAGAALLSRDSAGPPLPVGGLLIELAAGCAFGWMLAAALVAGTTWSNSGVRAAVGVLVAGLFSLADPRVVGWLWASPGPEWQRTHRHWVLVGVVSIVIFLLFSSDVARRPVLARRGR
jgi:hypothetical protein